MSSVNDMAIAVHKWADSVFPNRSAPATFIKLFEEVGEIIKSPSSGSEYADALILLLDLAVMHGVCDLEGEIERKMMVNKNRIWEKSPTGTYHHLRCSAKQVEWYNIGVADGLGGKFDDSRCPSMDLKDWYRRGYEHGTLGND